ncbi:MAG: type II secretion system protein [Bacilli bacterium]
MKLNKKGFTLIELLGVIVILGIITGIAVPAVTQYLRKAKLDTYLNYEKSMENAAENYLLENTNKIPNYNTSVTITAKELMGKYLDKLVDPEGGKKDACIVGSTVIVTRNNNTENIGMTYKTCLVCSKYKSKGC